MTHDFKLGLWTPEEREHFRAEWTKRLAEIPRRRASDHIMTGRRMRFWNRDRRRRAS